MYGADLARIHHEHFGQTAEAAAAELRGRLRAAGLTSGTVVDLACGSGLLARRLVAAGFDVLGVDLSPSMLDLARARAPGARFELASLWDIDLPTCVAVSAVGEAFNYATDAFTPDPPALERRLAAVSRALSPGGLLLFDVAGPGRSGPTGARERSWSTEGAATLLEEKEDGEAGILTRTLSTSVDEEGQRRRSREEHRLRLYTPEAVTSALARAGFTFERLEGYADRTEPLAGWHHFLAAKPA